MTAYIYKQEDCACEFVIYSVGEKPYAFEDCGVATVELERNVLEDYQRIQSEYNQMQIELETLYEQPK